MEINGVAHIQLTVGDFGAAVAFYEKLLPLLGLVPVIRNDSYYYCTVGPGVLLGAVRGSRWDPARGEPRAWQGAARRSGQGLIAPAARCENRGDGRPAPMVRAEPRGLLGLKFGLAFCEASGPCLIRRSGNDNTLVRLAVMNAEAIGAGHSFIIFLSGGFPVSVLNAIKWCPKCAGSSARPRTRPRSWSPRRPRAGRSWASSTGRARAAWRPSRTSPTARSSSAASGTNCSRRRWARPFILKSAP